jgi:hypothetical protein
MRNSGGSPVLRVLAFALAIACALTADWWLFSRQKQDFAAAGLGINTTSNEASFYAGTRRAICFSIEDLDRCLGALPPSSTRKRLLWLGWSQLYAINDYHAGDRTAPALLAERLEGQDVDLIAIAMPNINPREALLVYEYLRPRLRLSGVIVPAWLQGMKQEGIRPTWQAALADPAVRSALAALPSGSAILGSVAPQAKSAQEIGQQNLAKDTRTTQERVEQRLVAELTDRFAPWRVRSQAQGEIKLALLAGKEQVLRLRNLVLGTRAEHWINVIPPARYAINLEAFTDLVSAARRDGLPVLVYVPPRPGGHRFPFDPAVYAAFKWDSERIARQHGASFANIEDTVADDLWGEADNGAGEVVTDPSHFTAAGHRLMADALAGALSATILPQMQ